jgi:hypothetical protein
MVLSRLTNSTKYRLQISAVGHKDTAGKSCTMANTGVSGVGAAFCSPGGRGSYKYYQTARPSKPSSPLNFQLVPGSQRGGSSHFVWHDPVDFGGGGLMNYYIYANDNITIPIASTVPFSSSLLLTQDPVMLMSDNPLKGGRAVMLESFTTYSVEISAANSAEWCFGAGLRSGAVLMTTSYYIAPEQIASSPNVLLPSGGALNLEWSGFYLLLKDIEDPKNKDATVQVRFASSLDAGGAPITSYAITNTFMTPTSISGSLPLKTWVDFSTGIVDRLNANAVVTLNDIDATGKSMTADIPDASPSLSFIGSVLPEISHFGSFDKTTHVNVPIDLSIGYGLMKGVVTNPKTAVDSDAQKWYYSLVGKHQELSIAAWVRPSETTNYERVIASVGDVMKEKSMRKVGWSALLKMNQDQHPEFIIPTSTVGECTSVVSKHALTTNQWTHVVGVYNGVSLIIYINGQWSNEVKILLQPGTMFAHVVKSTSEVTAASLPVPTAQLHVGAAPGCDTTHTPLDRMLCPSSIWQHARWVGDIGDVRLYTAAIEEQHLLPLLNSWFPTSQMQYTHRRGLISTVHINDLESTAAPTRLLGGLQPASQYEVKVRAHSFVPPGNKNAVLTAHENSQLDIHFLNHGFATNPLSEGSNSTGTLVGNSNRGVTVSFYMKLNQMSKESWNEQLHLMTWKDADDQVILRTSLESSTSQTAEGSTTTTMMTVSNSDSEALEGQSAPEGTWQYGEWVYVAVAMKHLKHHTTAATTRIDLYVNGYLLQSSTLPNVPLHRWDSIEALEQGWTRRPIQHTHFCNGPHGRKKEQPPPNRLKHNEPRRGGLRGLVLQVHGL